MMTTTNQNKKVPSVMFREQWLAREQSIVFELGLPNLLPKRRRTLEALLTMVRELLLTSRWTELADIHAKKRATEQYRRRQWEKSDSIFRTE